MTRGVDLWGYYEGGQLGMEGPESSPNRDRWHEAAPKMAMALSEAGFPTRYEMISLSAPGRVDELVFTGGFPDDITLLKAAHLCGVQDLVEEAVILHAPKRTFQSISANPGRAES